MDKSFKLHWKNNYKLPIIFINNIIMTQNVCFGIKKNRKYDITVILSVSILLKIKNFDGFLNSLYLFNWAKSDKMSKKSHSFDLKNLQLKYHGSERLSLYMFFYYQRFLPTKRVNIDYEDFDIATIEKYGSTFLLFSLRP